eukprot:SAG22_NODE_19239_length_277_cov_0.331461_1_plen_60_part_10
MRTKIQVVQCVPASVHGCDGVARECGGVSGTYPPHGTGSDRCYRPILSMQRWRGQPGHIT